ncbi:MAG: S8 family serine peptidase [Pseudoxanthomonas sp.]
MGLGLRGVLLLAVVSCLAACGGGGGNVRSNPPPTVVPPPTTPTTPTPPVVTTPNPAYGGHISLTNTQAAHEAGLSGAGVVVGVVDSGVNHLHPALQGRVTNLVYVPSPPNDLSVDDVVGHGTAVSQIIAGQPFGAWPGGIAPGVSIVSARIIWDESPEDDGSGEGNEVGSDEEASGLGIGPIHDDLIARGVRIMNNSWGGLYWNNPDTTALIADEYARFIGQNDGLVVFATGNESRADPTDMAALPSQPGPDGTTPAAYLERGWLAVAALSSESANFLADYSNACGIAMHYCLSAPGTVVVTGTDDAATAPEYWQWSGTSLAAPQVSGAAALVWQAFPYFDNDLVRQTILGTATDLGAEGPDPVFGYGRLNVGAAVNGPGKFDWGDVVADFDGIASTWSNNIAGSGGLVKRGTGRLQLAGINRFTGETRIEEGTLAVMGTLSEGPVYVGSDGTLELYVGYRQSGIQTGGTVNGDLTNAGVLRVLGVQGGGREHLVYADYQQNEGATLEFEIGSTLHVTGTAQIAGNAKVLGVANGYVRGSSEKVLVADEGLSGRFGSLSAASGIFFEGSLAYTETDVLLNITRLDVAAAAMSMAGITPASLGAARRVEAAFDAIDGQQGGDVISTDFIAAAGRIQAASSEKEAVASLRSLSGELHAVADANGFDSIDANRRALSSRFGELAARPRLQGDWSQALGQPGQGGAGIGRFQSSGWLIGSDLRLGAYANAVAGFAFGETRADGLLAGGRGDRSHDRQTQAQFYLGGMRGNGYAMGQVGAGRYQRQLRRDLWLGERRAGVASEYAGDFVDVGVEAGYRFGGDAASLTPYAGVDYVRMDRDGFVENGADGFGLKAEASTAERTQAIVGLRAERRRGRFGLHGFAEWRQSLSERDLLIDASFVGAESWSPLQGEGYSRDSGLFGFAADAALGRGATLSFGYDQRVGSAFDDRRWTAKLRYGF